MKLIESFDTWNRLYEASQSPKKGSGVRSINEKEEFDLMKFLKQQVNVAKATVKIEKAVKAHWEAKTAQLQTESDFEEEWLKEAKQKATDLRDKFNTKISKSTDQNQKNALRAEKNAKLEKLDTALSELKGAKKDQFIQGAKDDVADAEKEVTEITNLDMPEWGKNLINGMKTTAENKEKVSYYETKYANNEKALEGAKKRAKEQEAEDAEKLKTATEQANLESDQDVDNASNSIKNMNHDPAANDDTKRQFNEGKDKFSKAITSYKTANQELTKAKQLGVVFATAKTNVQNAPDDQKDQKQSALDAAQANFSNAVDDFKKAKSKATDAFSSASAWANARQDSGEQDIKGLASQIKAASALGDSLDAIDIASD